MLLCSENCGLLRYWVSLFGLIKTGVGDNFVSNMRKGNCKSFISNALFYFIISDTFFVYQFF